MIGYSKKNREIIRETAFDNKKKKPRLKFNPRLALTGFRTTGPWGIHKKDVFSVSGTGGSEKKIRDSATVLPIRVEPNGLSYQGY